MRQECRERFPRHRDRLQRKPLVSDPGMNHGTCVTHVPRYMSGSIMRGGENVPGACATHNFTYLARGPLLDVCSEPSHYWTSADSLSVGASGTNSREIWNEILSFSFRNRRLNMWRHQTFSALLAICAENSPVPGEFTAQRPVTRSFDVFFDLRLNKRLSKQWWGWWFETLLHPLWRHRNEMSSAKWR